MMGVVIATVVAIVALVWIVLYVVREEANRREHIDHELYDARTPTLEYDVPTGQDPAVLMAALEKAGYTAAVDPNAARQILLVKCPEGLQAHREEVRSLIASANRTTADDGIPIAVDTRFRDER